MHTTLSLLGLALSLVCASRLDSVQQRSLPLSTCSQNITDLKWPNSIPTWRSGTPSGSPYCISRWDHGAKIVGLAAFKETSSSIGCDDKGGITRLEVRFDDGPTVAIGGSSTECQAGSFGLDYDELFSEVFSNVAGSNSDGQGKMGWAHYSLRAKDNIKWDYLKDEYNPGATQQNYATGGGLLIGLVGYQLGDVLETVVPIFSPAEIDHVTRGNVFYTPKNLEDIAISNDTLAIGHWINVNTTNPMGYLFSDTKSRTTTYTTRWAITTTGGMDYEIKLETGWKLPLLIAEKIELGAKTHWEISQENGNEHGDSTTHTLTWGTTGSVNKGKTVSCQALAVTANGAFTVTSDITMYFKDGSKWTYPSIDTIEGYNMVAPTVIITCYETDTRPSDFDLPGVQILDAPGEQGAQQLAIASYTNPLGDPAAWSRLISYDTTKLSVLVANVLNGPDYIVNDAWADVIRRAAASGKTIIGYVRTGYLGVSQQKFKTRLGSSDLADWASQIEQDVDKWYELYPQIGGIFFDEGWPECGANNMYSELYAYINAYTKRKHPGAFTVLNPGSPMAECFENTMDTLLTFESYYDYYKNQYVPNDWTPQDARKIWHIVYNVPQDKVAEVAALARSRGAGLIEITDDTTPNPYDNVPVDSYMQAAMAGVSGGGVRADAAQEVVGSYQSGYPQDSSVLKSDYTSVTITWSAVANALGYGVWQNDVLVLELPPALTRATVGMLAPGSSGILFEVKTILSSGVGSTRRLRMTRDFHPLRRTITADTMSLPSNGSYSGAIANVKYSTNGDTVTYTADVLVPFAFVRLFIGGPHQDGQASSGWPIALFDAALPFGGFATHYMLANYLVEGNDFYSAFYKYSGSFVEGSTSPADWTWSPSGVAPQSQSGYTYTWNVPLGGTDAIPDQYLIQGQGYAPISDYVGAKPRSYDWSRCTGNSGTPCNDP